MRTLTLAQARRMALAAQGFADPRPAGRVDIRHLRRAVRRVGALQIDSVNVVARAHLLTLHARLGAFDPALLDDAAYRRRELFEYWAHEAAYVPVALHPLLRPRMAAWQGRRATALEAEHPGYLDAVLAEVAEHGPLTPAELADPGERAGPWWGWSKGKLALEHLFATGRLAIADRRGFTRVYDLAERVLPAEVLALPTPDAPDAHRELLRLAAASCGVGTGSDLADHFRLKPSVARPILATMARRGELVEVAVRGWDEPAYAHPDAHLPRRVRARALLCPFDPVVWFRPRAERLFGFRYRIEIYTPAERRVHGYYVLPFLLGDALVARVDLKAERAARRLLVRGAYLEPAADGAEVAPSLAAELRDLARWLDLDAVVVEPRGDLAPALRAAEGSPARGDA
jgi:uncharacterized protein